MRSSLSRWCVVSIIAVGVAVAATAGAAAATGSAPGAQVVDPYTGGVVAPDPPCRPGVLTVMPGGVVRPGEQLTLGTQGQRPNSFANFYVAGVAVGSATTDGSGTASFVTQAPKGSSDRFEVAVGGACGTAVADIDPVAASALGGPLGRGFARTGLELLPWIAVALILIVLGRQLARRRSHGRRGSRRHNAPTGRSFPRGLRYSRAPVHTTPRR